MEKWEIKGHTLEFDDNTHTYYVDGVITPSVTQIIKWVYPNIYKDIDPRILERARELGHKMHKDIEDYENGLEVDASVELESYIKLKSFFDWKVEHCEIPIIIFNGDFPVCAGRIDQIINIYDKLCVNDLKRTKEVHYKELTLQLSLYALGYEQCYNRAIIGGYCTHLKKDVGEFIEIILKEDLAISKVMEYIKQSDKDDDFEW